MLNPSHQNIEGRGISVMVNAIFVHVDKPPDHDLLIATKILFFEVVIIACLFSHLIYLMFDSEISSPKNRRPLEKKYAYFFFKLVHTRAFHAYHDTHFYYLDLQFKLNIF